MSHVTPCLILCGGLCFPHGWEFCQYGILFSIWWEFLASCKESGRENTLHFPWGGRICLLHPTHTPPSLPRSTGTLDLKNVELYFLYFFCSFVNRMNYIHAHTHKNNSHICLTDIQDNEWWMCPSPLRTYIQGTALSGVGSWVRAEPVSTPKSSV